MALYHFLPLYIGAGSARKGSPPWFCWSIIKRTRTTGPITPMRTAAILMAFTTKTATIETIIGIPDNIKVAKSKKVYLIYNSFLKNKSGFIVHLINKLWYERKANLKFVHFYEDGTMYVQNTFWDLVIFKADILEAKRETMNDSFEDETEFGPNDQDKEMLVTSATWAGNCSLDFFLDEWVFYADHM